MMATDRSFHFFASYRDQITATFSNRHFSSETRPDFLKTLKLDAQPLYLVKQVHGENIIRIAEDTQATVDQTADGVITHRSEITIGILTADCVPVFYWDPEKKVIALAHAGWKGAYHRIASKMVAAFQQNFGSQAANIQVGIGPCIRREVYEVGSEFETYFPGFYYPSSIAGKGHLDLPGFVMNDLIQAGILRQNIEDCGFCTYQEPDHFYSYRRENQTRERILSVISMRN